MSNKKKIVYVEANEDGTIGGSHYCLLEIVKEIDRSKFEPVVCFYQDNDLVSEFRKHASVLFLTNPRGISFKLAFPRLYQIFNVSRFSSILFQFCQKAYNLLRFEFVFYLNVVRFVIKYKIDIIHINNAPILSQWLLASKLTATPIVAHVRGNLNLPKQQRKLVPKYDRIIAISDAVTQYAENHGIDTGKFFTIYDGIDVNAVRSLQKANSSDIRSEFGIIDDQRVVGVVGNIKDWKGQHVLVEAIDLLKEKYPDVICLIVGDVSDLPEDKAYYQKIKSLIEKRELEKRVIFTGYRSDIPDIISILDVMVHTSTEPEPLGRVVLEGMLFAKPVIATAHGGPVEIIEDNISGILVKPSDPAVLADKISQIFDNEDFRNSLCNAAVKRVDKKFSIESNVRSIEAQYEGL